MKFNSLVSAKVYMRFGMFLYVSTPSLMWANRTTALLSLGQGTRFTERSTFQTFQIHIQKSAFNIFY